MAYEMFPCAKSLCVLVCLMFPDEAFDDILGQVLDDLRKQCHC